MTPSIDLLERAAFAAWPSLAAKLVGGWLVRTAGGYTKRANSASWVTSDAMAPVDIVAGCHAVFAGERLPTIFRLVARPQTEAMERFLADAGWRLLDASLVMAGEVEAAFPTAALDVDWSQVSLAEWAAVHAKLAGQDAATAARHLRLLQAMRQPCVPAIVSHQGEAVACGLAVIDGRLLGFFDIVTSPAQRGRGYARRLMAGQVARARRFGVERLYLQVVAGNAPAVGLYRRLGFGEAYRYSYRAERAA